jgi:hypothetical protein
MVMAPTRFTSTSSTHATATHVPSVMSGLAYPILRMTRITGHGQSIFLSFKSAVTMEIS